MTSSAPARVPEHETTASSGIPWWPEPRPSGRDTGRLDRDRIAAAALRILDEEGFDALSMRRLATTLDAGTMSVYWHVATKDELLAHVVDLVMADVVAPAPDGDWVAQLRGLAWSTRGVLREHPEVARVILQGVMAGPALLRLQELTLAILRRAGFDEADSIRAFFTVGLVITSSLVNPVPQPENLALERDRWNAGNRQRNLDPAMYPTIVELADGLEVAPDDTHFEFALETMLAGLAYQHATLVAGDG